ncbi:aldo/keto reductase [bacterium]|nr:aldo/keto reductase [bacterium]
MQYNQLGNTGFNISRISFGAWAIGGSWGTVNDRDSYLALERAIDMGVNFFDTADVYGDGHSEKLIGKLRRDHPDIIVATKAGRRLNPHTPEGYNLKNLTTFVERSLRNLATDSLDLLQLHCPPTDVYYMPETFQALDDLVSAGKIQYYGVSVERVEEALKAIQYPNVQSIQIVFNMFRTRPAELLFKEAQDHKVGIIARVPLASGLLTGKLEPNSTFEADDHRSFNRTGSAFDQGETFSGVEFELGLKAARQIQALCPNEMSMAQFALRWILMFKAVSAAIPGAKRPSQVAENVVAADFARLSKATMDNVQGIYDSTIRKSVHHRW